MAQVRIEKVRKAFGLTPVTHDRIEAEPTGSETLMAKLGGEDIIAVFRERHRFEPGDKVRLKPDPGLVHLFDEASGKRLNA